MNIPWSRLPLFLRTLEEQGFALLPERYDLVLQIVQHCENTDELGSKLRALLSSSAQQQRQFEEWFERFFNPGSGTITPVFTSGNPENEPIQDQRIQEILDKELAAQIAARNTDSKITNPKSFTLFEIIALAILSLIAVALQITILREYVVWMWVVVLSLYPSLAIFILRRLLKRPAQPFTLKREKLDIPPGSLFDIHIPPHREIRFGRSFQDIARSLRQRLSTDQPVLDPAATVRSSIRQGGFFTPQYSYRSKTPAYLMLINQTSAANHRFHLAEELHKWMQKQDIEVERLWFRNDPRSCWNEAHPTGIPLEQLAQRYPESRLLLFGDGWQLLNPVTQKLATWAQTFTQWDTRNLITPIVPKAWTTKEKNLAQLFVLAPASVEGLRYWSNTYASQMDNGASKAPEWRENPVIITTQNFEGALQRHFPDVDLREWLCALACFPKLNWELTLYIGSWLSINHGVYLLHYDNLRLLTRLSWFHNGFIPEEMRKLLYAQLDEGIKPKVHQCIVQVLAEQVQDGKSHFSLSRREMELQIVVQQVAAGRVKASELKRYRESNPDQGQEADFLVLHYLEQAHETPLPEKLAALLLDGRQQLLELWPKPKPTPPDNEKEQNDQEKKQRENIVPVTLSKDIQLTSEDIYKQITSEDIYQQTLYFESLFYELIETDQNFVWDINLTPTNEYRTKAFSKDSIYNQEQKSKLLTEFLPPYLWIARAEVSGYPEMEFIFDATAIPYSNDFCITVLFFDEVLEDLIKESLTAPEEYDKERYLLINNVNQFIDSKLNDAYIWSTIKNVLFETSQDKKKETTTGEFTEKQKEGHPANEDNTHKETQNKASDEKSDLRSLKAAWIQLIAQADIETPLKESLAYCKQFMESRVDEAVQMQGRYNSLLKNYRIGILTYENYSIERNRISDAFLDFINSL